MRKRRLKTWVVLLFIIICFGLVIFSLSNILLWKNNVDKNNKRKKDLSKYIKEKDDKYIIDFNKLKEENKDVIAYLKVNNTNIDYVVVKGKDNDYYLNHNFDKEYSEIGWIFMDYRNNLDGTDKNIVIYGHNTKDGSMFGSLRKVLTNNWQSDINNHVITLVTEK